MSVVAILIVLVSLGVVVFLSYATTREHGAVAFSILVMTLSVAFIGGGVMMMLQSRDTGWQGVVLACVGLPTLLATMVAHRLLLKR